MKRLFLIVFSLVTLANLAFSQGIRSTADTVSKPVGNLAQPIIPDTYTGRQILVGSGGGFTGFTTTYYLFENGKLFRRRSREITVTFIGQQTTAQTKRLFSTVEGICKIKRPSSTIRAIITRSFSGEKESRTTECSGEIQAILYLLRTQNLSIRS